MQPEGPKARLPFVRRLGMFGIGALSGVVLAVLSLVPALKWASEREGRNGMCAHGPLGSAAFVNLGPPLALAALGAVLFGLTFALPREKWVAPFSRGLIAFAFSIVVLPLLAVGALAALWDTTVKTVGCTGDLLRSGAEAAEVVLRLALSH